MTAGILGILTLNVQSPPAARAQRQLEWLAGRDEHIFVLTEVSGAAGSRLLAERLAGAGWEVRFPHTEGGERGLAIASRLRLEPRAGDVIDYLPARAEAVACGPVDVVGLYVPSRDDSGEKTARKRRFCAGVSALLAEEHPRDTVVIGDLNVVEPTHRPHYGFFRDWEYQLYEEFAARGWSDAYRHRHPGDAEYSWMSSGDEGFRFDHAFVTESLADRVMRCDYVHETRQNALSDHSALTLQLAITGSFDELEVHNPVSGAAPTLF